MLDSVPVQAWLLIAAAAAGFVPARNLIAYAARSWRPRDITLPPAVPVRRSRAELLRDVAILAALAVFAVFIFTPTAAAFARSPQFLPVLLLGLGGIALYSVATAYRSGAVEPMLRGASWTFTRTGQPRRYWASMAWNALLGGGMLAIGVSSIYSAPIDALRDACHDWDGGTSAADQRLACDSLLRERPEEDRSNLLASRGTAFYRMGDYRRARADYAAAVRLDPGVSAFHYDLGLAHDRLGDVRRATADYDAAIRIDATNADALLNRGTIFLDMGRFDRAIADFDRTLSLRPGDVAAHGGRAMAHAWRGDRPAAERDLAAMRKVDPTDVVLLRGEALLAFKRGDGMAAIRALDTAIALHPDDAWARAMRSRAMRVGDPTRSWFSDRPRGPT